MGIYESEKDILTTRRIAEIGELLDVVHPKKLPRVGASLCDISQLPEDHQLRRVVSRIESRYRKEGDTNPQDLMNMTACIAMGTDIELDTLRGVIESKYKKGMTK